jgi:hypothetical protein
MVGKKNQCHCCPTYSKLHDDCQHTATGSTVFHVMCLTFMYTNMPHMYKSLEVGCQCNLKSCLETWNNAYGYEFIWQEKVL